MSGEFVILKAAVSDGSIESVTFSGAMKDELEALYASHVSKGLCVLFISFNGGCFNVITPPDLEIKIEKSLITSGAIFTAPETFN